MTNETNEIPAKIKEQLATATQKLEGYLEPWQREYPEPRELTEVERKKIEALAEERILKRAELLKPETEKDKQQQQILILLLIAGIGYYFFIYLDRKRTETKSEIRKLFQANPTISVSELDATEELNQPTFKKIIEDYSKKVKKARVNNISTLQKEAGELIIEERVKKQGLHWKRKLSGAQKSHEKAKEIILGDDVPTYKFIRGEIDPNTKLDNNALFYGAPRTGKSVMAEKLAYEADMYPLVVIQGSTLTPRKNDYDAGIDPLAKFIFTLCDIDFTLTDNFGLEREEDGEVRYILFVDEANQITTSTLLSSSTGLTFLKECMGSDNRINESHNLWIMATNHIDQIDVAVYQPESFDGKFVNPRQPKIEEVLGTRLKELSESVEELRITVRSAKIQHTTAIEGKLEEIRQKITTVRNNMPVAESAVLIVGGLFALFKAVSDGINTKREKLAISSKEVEQRQKQIENLMKDNSDFKKRNDEIFNLLKKGKKQEETIRDRLKDPNLSPEEKKKLEEQLALIISQNEEYKKELDNNNEKIRENEEEIKKNQSILAQIASNLNKESNGILDYITLENIIIVGGCYMAYKLLKDDK
nr:815_t:CDS:2 [Entrophospora candida]